MRRGLNDPNGLKPSEKAAGNECPSLRIEFETSWLRLDLQQSTMFGQKGAGPEQLAIKIHDKCNSDIASAEVSDPWKQNKTT